MTVSGARTHDGRRVALLLVVPVVVASAFLLPSVVLLWLLAPVHVTAAVALGAAVVAVPALVGRRARRRDGEQPGPPTTAG